MNAWPHVATAAQVAFPGICCSAGSVTGSISSFSQEDTTRGWWFFKTTCSQNGKSKSQEMVGVLQASLCQVYVIIFFKSEFTTHGLIGYKFITKTVQII